MCLLPDATLAYIPYLALPDDTMTMLDKARPLLVLTALRWHVRPLCNLP